MRKRKLKRLLEQTIVTVRALRDQGDALADCVEDLANATHFRRPKDRPNLRYLGEVTGKAEASGSKLWSAERRLDEIFAPRERETGGPGNTGGTGSDQDPGA